MPLLTLLDLLFGLFVISLVVNLTSTKLPLHYVPWVMRWGWFSSLIYVTIRAMMTDSVQQWLRGNFRPSVLSYLVAAILGAGVGVFYWAIISKIEQSKLAEPAPAVDQPKSTIDPSKLLSLETSLSDYLYPTGTVVGGIAWQPNLVDVRLFLTSAHISIKNLDLEISLNEGMEDRIGIAEIKETNGISCTFLPQMAPGVPALSRDRLFGKPKTDKKGNRVIKPANVTQILSPMYRVQCPYLEKRTNLSLIIAAAEIKVPAPTKTPGQRIQVTVGPVKVSGPRQFPTNILIEGSYEADVLDGRQKFSFKQILPLEKPK